ncbi:hypothetical protein QQF64_002837 [Cirrhinus molitorella]|uniref:G-protein coupled receptors family 1 profile domain-containing protein n=1 Tax=Cirrhinus molitorella TaxID=172907 RepID=A0ABR3MRB7_9TELE
MEDYYDILGYPMIVTSLVFYYLTLILGVPGNTFVLYVAGLKMKRTVNTVGFLNLAFADLLCCLCCLFYVARNAFDTHWPYGSIMCKLLPFIMSITKFTSVFTLTLISLDRFAQVITPVWAQNHRSLLIARLSCVAAWILALILSLPFMMLRETKTKKQQQNNINHQPPHTTSRSSRSPFRPAFCSRTHADRVHPSHHGGERPSLP